MDASALGSDVTMELNQSLNGGNIGRIHNMVGINKSLLGFQPVLDLDILE